MAMLSLWAALIDPLHPHWAFTRLSLCPELLEADRSGAHFRQTADASDSGNPSSTSTFDGSSSANSESEPSHDSRSEEDSANPPSEDDSIDEPSGGSSEGTSELCNSTSVWSCGWELVDSDCEDPGDPPSSSGDYDGEVAAMTA